MDFKGMMKMSLTNCKLGKTLKDLYALFNDSIARRTDYTELTGMSYAGLGIYKENRKEKERQRSLKNRKLGKV